jgi:type I restriction enzyme S subunit
MVAVVPEDFEDAHINQHVALCRASAQVDRNYIAWYLSSESGGLRQLRTLERGATKQGLGLSDIFAVEIPLAPLPEQQRIVAKIEELFSDLDAGVAALERAKANLKRYRAAVLKAAVEGQLTAAWRAEHPNVEPASKLLERILTERRQKWEAAQLAKFAAANKEPPKNWKSKYVQPSPPDTSDLPVLPVGWCWTNVEQVGDVQLGRQRSPKNRSNKYPTKYIRAANLTESGLDITDVLDMEFQPRELETYQLKAGDVLLSEASGSPDQVGKPAVWNDEIEKCCFQNTVIRLRPARVHSDYALTVFRHYYRNKMFAKVAAGVGINHLSAAKFSLLPFPLAPLQEQIEIVGEVESALSQTQASEVLVEISLKRAARLRQSILKQAFEGKLVPQDPTDEPASALLERLRATRAVNETNGKPRSPARKRGRRGAASKRK